jgi:hypothetical protein
MQSLQSQKQTGALYQKQMPIATRLCCIVNKALRITFSDGSTKTPQAYGANDTAVACGGSGMRKQCGWGSWKV